VAGNFYQKSDVMLEIRNYNLGNYIVPEEVHNKVCVDIGANVGSFLTQHGHKFKTVQFYEPYTPCYNICVGLGLSNTTGYREAVYHTSGISLNLLGHRNMDSGSTALQSEITTEYHGWSPDSENVVEKVKTVDLKTVLKRAGGFVDYMKIDCETGEYDFLMNKDLSAINYIAIEVHIHLEPQKWNELINHISKTHKVVDGVTHYPTNHENSEILFALNR
jgi:FkbM family methyltransferase